VTDRSVLHFDAELPVPFMISHILYKEFVTLEGFLLMHQQTERILDTRLKISLSVCKYVHYYVSYDFTLVCN